MRRSVDKRKGQATEGLPETFAPVLGIAPAARAQRMRSVSSSSRASSSSSRAAVKPSNSMSSSNQWSADAVGVTRPASVSSQRGTPARKMPAEPLSRAPSADGASVTSGGSRCGSVAGTAPMVAGSAPMVGSSLGSGAIQSRLGDFVAERHRTSLSARSRSRASSSASEPSLHPTPSACVSANVLAASTQWELEPVAEEQVATVPAAHSMETVVNAEALDSVDAQDLGYAADEERGFLSRTKLAAHRRRVPEVTISLSNRFAALPDVDESLLPDSDHISEEAEWSDEAGSAGESARAHPPAAGLDVDPQTTELERQCQFEHSGHPELSPDKSISRNEPMQNLDAVDDGDDIAMHQSGDDPAQDDVVALTTQMQNNSLDDAEESINTSTGGKKKKKASKNKKKRQAPRSADVVDEQDNVVVDNASGEQPDKRPKADPSAADILQHIQGILSRGLGEATRQWTADQLGDDGVNGDQLAQKKALEAASVRNESCRRGNQGVACNDKLGNELLQMLDAIDGCTAGTPQAAENSCSSGGGSSNLSLGRNATAQTNSKRSTDDRLPDPQADQLAIFTARLNEQAISAHLKTACARRVVLATPVEVSPATGLVEDVLPVQLGAVIICEAVDTSGWGFGSVLVPTSLAGKRGCFRCLDMRPVVATASMQRLTGDGAVDIRPGAWKDLNSATESTQHRLKQKALFNRTKAARIQWESLKVKT